MRKLVMFVLASISIAAGGSLATAADPPSTGSLAISVPATAGDALAPATWSDSGFALKANAPAVTITATGTAQFCPFAGLVGAGGCSTTPDGPITGSPVPNPFPPGGCPLCTLPGANIGALVVSVAGGPPLLVGSGPTQLTGSGELYFGYNDGFLAHFDNVGAYAVTITYPCQPGHGNGDENHYHCGPPGQG